MTVVNREMKNILKLFELNGCTITDRWTKNEENKTEHIYIVKGKITFEWKTRQGRVLKPKILED